MYWGDRNGECWSPFCRELNAEADQVDFHQGRMEQAKGDIETRCYGELRFSFGTRKLCDLIDVPLSIDSKPMFRFWSM